MKNSQADGLVLRRRKTRLAFVMLTFYSAFDGSDISQIEGVYFHPTLCLENSPRILKVPSTLNSGFFLFTPFILNGLELQKGERNQHRFFSDIL